MALTALTTAFLNLLNGVDPGGPLGQRSEEVALGTVIQNIITQSNAGAAVLGLATDAATASTLVLRDPSGDAALSTLTVATIAAAGPGGIALGSGDEIVGVPLTLQITLTPASVTGPLFVLPADCVVHRVWAKTIVSWDGTTGLFTVGDGDDADGYLAMANAELVTTFDESNTITGWNKGSKGLKDDKGGLYQWDATDDSRLQKHYPTADNIDATVTTGDSTVGTTIVYCQYTRLS